MLAAGFPMTYRRPADRGALFTFTFRLARLRLFVGAFCAVAAMASATVASAQSIGVVNENSLPRLDKDKRIVQKRSLTLTPEAVNLQDCIDDQLIRFTLQMSGFEANASVQVWASNSGQDCKAETARGGGVQTCWRAFPTDIALQTTVDVDIPVRSIMAGAPPFSAQNPNATAEACGQVNLSTISVHFLYFAPGNLSQAAQAKTLGITVDTVGPKPPSGLKALPGDTRIQVSWVNISGGSGDASATGGLTELTGVKVYCDVAGTGPSTSTPQSPPACRDEPVDASVDDSGDAAPDAATTVRVCEDGGATSAPATTSGCTTPNFIKSDGSKIFPTAEFNSKYECGSIAGNTGTTVVASSIGSAPLTNGTTYAVAVAATDKFGNVGELSDVICETPEVTTDFWGEYKSAGGQAGGGCSTSGSEVPIGGISALVVIVATAGSSLRRRRLPPKGREPR